MPWQIVSAIEFRDVRFDSDVYMSVRIWDRWVNLLVTGQHNGDCDVSFWPVQGQRLADGLECAGEMLGKVEMSQDEVEVVGVEGAYFTPGQGPLVRTSVTVGLYEGAIHLHLAWEGDPDEEDDADTYLDLPTSQTLAQSLREACGLALLSNEKSELED